MLTMNPDASMYVSKLGNLTKGVHLNDFNLFFDNQSYGYANFMHNFLTTLFVICSPKNDYSCSTTQNFEHNDVLFHKPIFNNAATRMLVPDGVAAANRLIISDVLYGDEIGEYQHDKQKDIEIDAKLFFNSQHVREENLHLDRNGNLLVDHIVFKLQVMHGGFLKWTLVRRNSTILIRLKEEMDKSFNAAETIGQTMPQLLRSSKVQKLISQLRKAISVKDQYREALAVFMNDTQENKYSISGRLVAACLGISSEPTQLNYYQSEPSNSLSEVTIEHKQNKITVTSFIQFGLTTVTIERETSQRMSLFPESQRRKHSIIPGLDDVERKIDDKVKQIERKLDEIKSSVEGEVRKQASGFRKHVDDAKSCVTRQISTVNGKVSENTRKVGEFRTKVEQNLASTVVLKTKFEKIGESAKQMPGKLDELKRKTDEQVKGMKDKVESNVKGLTCTLTRNIHKRTSEARSQVEASVKNAHGEMNKQMTNVTKKQSRLKQKLGGITSSLNGLISTQLMSFRGNLKTAVIDILYKLMNSLLGHISFGGTSMQSILMPLLTGGIGTISSFAQGQIVSANSLGQGALSDITKESNGVFSDIMAIKKMGTEVWNDVQSRNFRDITDIAAFAGKMYNMAGGSSALSNIMEKYGLKSFYEMTPIPAVIACFDNVESFQQILTLYQSGECLEDDIMLTLDTMECLLDIGVGVVEQIPIFGPIFLLSYNKLKMGKRVGIKTYSSVKTVMNNDLTATEIADVSLALADEIAAEFGLSSGSLRENDFVQKLSNWRIGNEKVFNTVSKIHAHQTNVKYVFTPYGVFDKDSKTVTQVPDNSIDLRERIQFRKADRSLPKETGSNKLICRPPYDDTEAQQASLTGQAVSLIGVSVGQSASGQSITDYSCAKAFGITFENHNFADGEKGTSIIDLGVGTDSAFGFTDSENVFIIKAGHKNFTGGRLKDTFVLLENELITGTIDGLEGSNNVLDFSEYMVDEKIKIVDSELTIVDETGQNEQSDGLSFRNIGEIFGRQGKTDEVTCSCSMSLVATGGGLDINSQDLIVIPNVECQYSLVITMFGNTIVKNHATDGSFKYDIYEIKDVVKIELFQPDHDTATESSAKIEHNFKVNNLPVQNITKFELTQNNVTLYTQDGYLFIGGYDSEDITIVEFISGVKMEILEGKTKLSIEAPTKLSTQEVYARYLDFHVKHKIDIEASISNGDRIQFDNNVVTMTCIDSSTKKTNLILYEKDFSTKETLIAESSNKNMFIFKPNNAFYSKSYTDNNTKDIVITFRTSVDEDADKRLSFINLQAIKNEMKTLGDFELNVEVFREPATTLSNDLILILSKVLPNGTSESIIGRIRITDGMMEQVYTKLAILNYDLSLITAKEDDHDEMKTKTFSIIPPPQTPLIENNLLLIKQDEYERFTRFNLPDYELLAPVYEQHENTLIVKIKKAQPAAKQLDTWKIIIVDFFKHARAKLFAFVFKNDEEIKMIDLKPSQITVIN